MPKKNTNNNADKEMAMLFLELYINCEKYKEKHPQKNINCEPFLKKFIDFDDNNTKNQTHIQPIL